MPGGVVNCVIYYYCIRLRIQKSKALETITRPTHAPVMANYVVMRL